MASKTRVILASGN